MAARGADGRFVAGIELGLEDRLSGPLAKLAAKFEPWRKRVTSVWDPLTKASKTAEKAFAKAANMKQAADGIKGFSSDVSGLIEKPIKTFMGFEKQMSSVKSALFADEDTAESRKAMEEVAKTARKLGAETQFSATQAAEGMDILAKNFKDGPQKAQEVMAAMPGILDVAAAGTVSIAEASDVASAAMNQFGLQAKDMNRIGDVLVKTANSSATGISDIGEALKNSGVAAAGAGISLEKTTALIGALGNAGVKGGEAGTALRAMILKLQAPTAKGKSALKFLGIDPKDKAGNLKPIEDILAEIDKKADAKFGADKNGNRRAALMKGLFEDEAFAAANVLTAQAGSGELAKVIEANFKSAGTASKTAKVMSDNAAGAMANYESAVEELQLTIGEKLIPRVTELFKWADQTVTKFAAWAKENDGLVTVLGYVAGAVGIAGGAVWGIISAVGAATTAWGALVKVWGYAEVAAGLVTKGLNFMKLAALSNPVTAIVIGLATAALLVYQYWEPIKGFFTGLWDGVTSAFKAATDWIFAKIEWAGEKVRHLGDYLTGKESYTNEGAAAGQERLRGMSEADLQGLAGAGGAVGDQARQILIEKRKAKEQAPAVLEAASRAAAGVGAGFSDPFKAFTSPAPSAMTMPGGVPLGMPAGVPIDLPQGAQAKGQKSEFAGDLKITIDSEGQVKGTKLKTAGTPGFAVRVNTGVQA